MAASGSIKKNSHNTTTCITAINMQKNNTKNIFDSGSGYSYKSLKTLLSSGFVFFKIWEVAA